MNKPEFIKDLGTRIIYNKHPFKFALWKCGEIGCNNTFEASFHDISSRRKRNCGCRMNLQTLPDTLNGVRILEDLGTIKNRRHAMFECPICNSPYRAEVSSMKLGRAKMHCGCYIKPKTEKPIKIKKDKVFVPRQKDHPLWTTWKGMVNRCHYEKDNSYHNYGGRGITVCDRWRYSFLAFIEDMPAKPEGKYTLDRINNDMNYEPYNCKWSTYEEQHANKRLNKRN